MEKQPRESLSILNRSDRDRILDAVDLLRQVIEDLTETRAFPVPRESFSPGALYELAEEADSINEERMWSEDNAAEVDIDF
jgi:hypothetical protein